MTNDDEIPLIPSKEAVRRRRKDNVQKWPKLKTFLYDSEHATILGDSYKEWGKTVLFYCAFSAGLLGFYILMLMGLALVMDEITPMMTGHDSALANVPGMSFRPMPDFESTLIRFIQGKPETYKPFSDHIQAFLLYYENEQQVGEHFIYCDPNAEKPDEDKVCRFEVNWLGGDCNWQMDYGYDDGEPCILIKLNKVIGWIPDLYQSIDEIPDESARQFIANHGGFSPNYMPVSCHGRYWGDEQNMGNMSVYPSAGFPKVYYPYLNQEGFRSPLVMLKFNEPINGIAINIICKVWAKNVPHYKQDNVGTITFTLMVD